MPIIMNLPRSYLKTIEIVPYQSGSLIYSGSAQSPTWTGYDPSSMDIQETAQTDAGEYPTVFTPKHGYRWPDKTKEPKTVYWSIDKATPVVTAPTPASLTYNGSSQILVTSGSTTGGTLQYSLDNTNWSTDVSRGTNAGSYVVYYRVVGGRNYNDVASQNVAVSIAKATPVVTAPTAKSLVYSGSAQTLANAGSTTGGTLQYSSNNSSWSTSIPTGTNAGSYTVYYRVVGDSNYNDVSSHNIGVTIAKANPSTPTLSKTSITFNDSITQATFTVTRSGDGTVTATSSNTSVATVSVSGTTVTVSSVNNTSGSATITVKVNEGTNYNAYTGTGATCSITATFIIGTLQITVANGTASSVTASNGSSVVSLNYVNSVWTGTVGKGTWTIQAFKPNYTVSGIINVNATQIYAQTLTFANLPDGYTQMTYITATNYDPEEYLYSGVWIDPGYSIVSDNRLQGKFVLPVFYRGLSHTVFKATADSSSYRYDDISLVTSSDTMQLVYQSSYNRTAVSCGTPTAEVEYTYDARGIYININGSDYIITNNEPATNAVPIEIHVSRVGYITRVHQYYINIWNTSDTAKVANLLAAKRNSDSVYGMYDTIRDVFYTGTSENGSRPYYVTGG